MCIDNILGGMGYFYVDVYFFLNLKKRVNNNLILK